MTNTPTNGPSVSEINRRLQRVEDKLDERIATVDMLQAQEKLFQAREITHTAENQSLKDRVARIESAQSRFAFMLAGAFLALLIQFVVIVLGALGKGG